MFRLLLFIPIVLLTGLSTVKAQEQTIQLSEPTTYDYLSAGIQSFRTQPGLSPTGRFIEQEELKLPSDTSGSYFFSVYIGNEEDSRIIVMVTPTSEGEWLHIDLDNDNDLTNDGGPFLFQRNENEFSFFVNHTSDTLQKAGRLLLRYPKAVLDDSTQLREFIKENFDQDGNLNQYWTSYWRRYNPNFDGTKGTFYYTDRLNIRKGQIEVNESSYMLGLNDWTANGKYNDERDRIFIDLNQDGKLTPRNTGEAFKLTDTLSIEDKAFRLTSIDPYGRSLTIKQVSKQEEPFYISYSDEIKVTTNSDSHFPASIAQTFWEKEFETLAKETLNMASLKGKFTLLNFWGEWCAPCYKEIPLLVEANEMYPDKQLQIISFLSTYNLPKAQKVMSEYGMKWHHILLDQQTANLFNVRSYPLNILIFPDGETAIISGGIEEGYFEGYIN